MSQRRYEITDFEWSIIAPLLPNKPRGVPRTRTPPFRSAEVAIRPARIDPPYRPITTERILVGP